MSAVETISAKRDGRRLDVARIEELVAGYVDGSVPDYQMGAFAMAVCLNGMDAAETAALTGAMLASGVTLEWPDDGRPVVDKHSTGGVGDKVSLVLAPLLACCGLRVPMISGRGLGPTGGTLDKLESIPGFRTDLSLDEIRDITDRVGCVITGATEEIAPADRRLYALRDVTATVSSIPLITASIMCKKLAEGLDALVLDVKFGSGAFMKSYEDAATLARAMVDVGEQAGVCTAALLTDMNQPLGRMVGNAVEVDETVAALCGDGPPDLMEVTLALGTELLLSAKIDDSRENAVARLNRHIHDGTGVEKFREMVAAQGGDLDAPRRKEREHVLTNDRSGYVYGVDAERIGREIIELGGGRRVMTDAVDHAVGVEMLVRIGDEIERGQPLIRIYAAEDAYRRVEDAYRRVEESLRASISIGSSPPAVPQLVRERIVFDC